jgi:phage baseplate assembly protein W
MASFGVALPLTKNSADGFTMIKSFRKLIKQNLKMLVLTHPGERVMEPAFGVGIKRLLFENYDDSAFLRAKEAIRTQTKRYMPAVQVVEVLFDVSPANQDRNTVGITIFFAVPDIGMTEMLEFTI